MDGLTSLTKRLMLGEIEDGARKGRNGQDKEWTICMESDVRAYLHLYINHYLHQIYQLQKGVRWLLNGTRFVTPT